MEIKREASDKIKGFSLQKSRAIKLALETILLNSNAQIHTAIEYNGDVFIFSDKFKYLEENKNYDSKNFSFNSRQVLNTIIYFLDYWLRETSGKSKNITFSYYSTNKIANENTTEKSRILGVTYPAKPILELLSSYDFTDAELIAACKKLILNYYEESYSGRKHNYDKIEKFTDSDWKDFFSLIKWNFEMPEHKELESEIDNLLTRFASKNEVDISGKEKFVKAYLKERLEGNQYTESDTQRFLTTDSIKLACYEVTSKPIQPGLYKYIDLKISTIKKFTLQFAQKYLETKYYSINNKNKFPDFLKRKVKRHNSEIRIQLAQVTETRPEALSKMEVTVGRIESLLNSGKPNFLFGEIGSGKSSIVANMILEQEKLVDETLYLIIPINYIKGSIGLNYETVFSSINNFFANNIDSSQGFDLKSIFLSKTQLTLVFDGLDELDGQEARYLINHLSKMHADEENVTIIVTGRPQEIQSLITFNDWNCLTTIDLSDEEMIEILRREAISGGMPIQDVDNDAKKRFNFLKNRNELYTIAKTPLVICLVRDYLVAEMREQSLGSLLYNVLNKRLEWDEIDLKANYSEFFDAYPKGFQREKLLAEIAKEINKSKNKNINEERLHQIAEDFIPVSLPNRNKTIAQGLQFYKLAFLQNVSGAYSFISQPLFEISYAVYLAEMIKREDFKLDFETNDWRPFAFAAGINRLKGYIDQSRVAISTYFEHLLQFEGNTPHCAIIVSESKDKHTAEKYFDLISKLSFRPLRTWGDGTFFSPPDSYSPIAIADSILIAGQKGFQWFFEEYLNPKNPTHTNEEHLLQYILQNYFSIKGFNIEASERDRLQKIIQPHLTARTSGCNYILSVLCLIMPEMFSVEHRCLAYADLMAENSLRDKCLQSLRSEIADGNLAHVLNALETICNKTGVTKDSACLLWLELNEYVNNSVILNTSIKCIAEGNSEILELVDKKVGREAFNAYLKFCVLAGHEVSSFAAIVLYNFAKERNFFLVGRPLLEKAEWFEYKEEKRKAILDDVLFENPEYSLCHMLNSIPLKRKRNKDEIPELFINYFIDLLAYAEKIYKEQFLYVVNRLPDYPILCRFPELRENIKKLVYSKPQYKIFLKEASNHLDFRLRFNANSIIIACFPDDCKYELENSIYSAYQRFTDHHEWVRFCMKLNYSRNVLEHVNSLIPDLPENSKIFALAILYHQGFPLSPSLKSVLLKGLLGEGSIFDSSFDFSNSDGLKRILGSEEFFDEIRESLYQKDFKLAAKSASALASFYYDKLNKKDLAWIYILESENWERNLYDFDKTKIELFQDAEFMEAFQECSKTITLSQEGSEPLLQLYYKTINGDGASWMAFLKKLIFKRRNVDNFIIESLSYWLHFVRKKRPNDALIAGKSIKELTTYPSVMETTGYNSIYPGLLNIASEFDSITKEEIERCLLQYDCHDEIACSLIYRLEEIPKGYSPHRFGESYLTFFLPNKSVFIKKPTDEEIDKATFDGNSIPSHLGELMSACILFRIYNDSEIDEKSKEGTLASFFYSVIKFCRSRKVDYELLLSGVEKIGWPFYRSNINQSLVNILAIIKEIQFDSKESVKEYSKHIISKIDAYDDFIKSDLIDLFRELFYLDVSFEVKHLIKLFDALVNSPTYFSLDLMSSISEYVVKQLKQEESRIITDWCDKYLKACLNHYRRRDIDEEIIGLLWAFSLINLYLTKREDEYSVLGFLKGLEAIFIPVGGRSYAGQNNSYKTFKARDMLNYSFPLFEKIDSGIIHYSIEIGMEKGTPEIRSLCTVLNTLAKGNFRAN